MLPDIEETVLWTLCLLINSSIWQCSLFLGVHRLNRLKELPETEVIPARTGKSRQFRDTAIFFVNRNLLTI